nr:unnamed protein product [Spirometra erinaceieuropaei]
MASVLRRNLRDVATSIRHSTRCVLIRGIRPAWCSQVVCTVQLNLGALLVRWHGEHVFAGLQFSKRIKFELGEHFRGLWTIRIDSICAIVLTGTSACGLPGQRIYDEERREQLAGLPGCSRMPQRLS